MKKQFALMIALLTGLLLYGCSTSRTILEPTGNESRVDNTTAKMNVNGITVISKTNQWTGDQQVNDKISPVLVTIQNNGNIPVKISYGQFALISDNGKRYNALPPFQINGTIEKPVLVYKETPITTPEFEYNNFLIAPYYAQVYPGIGVYTGTYYFDPMYYDNYYHYCSTLQTTLPTPDMVAKALPEGVLQPGGSVTGFVYFEKVEPSSTSKVNFQIDLVNPQDGNNFATIDIPYNVIRQQ